ncbi:MAG: restriction endonuclease subunit S [Planctomycetota bacterium]
MREDVSTLPLEDCMSAIIDYRGKTPRKTQSGIPLITAKIVKGGRIEEPTEFIDPAEYDDWMRRGLPEAGDVLLTTEAPLGEVAQLHTHRVALAQRLILLRGHPKKLDNSYLKYLLISDPMQSQLRGRASGTTVVGIKQRELRKVELPLPPLPEQRAIAGVLGALADKIEQNRRTAEKLEELARATFRAWFVDFAPVHAKAAGQTTYPGLPHEAFAALPTNFQPSSLGLIPEGWEAKSLDEACIINPKLKLKKGETAPYLDMKNMPTQGHRPNDIYDRPFGSGMRFQNADTLVARITPCLENGKTAYVDFLEDDQIAWGSTEYIVIRPQPPLPPIYGYCLARTQEFRDFAIQNMSGTSGRQRVPPKAMEHFSIAVPCQTVARAFGTAVTPLFDLIKARSEESEKLAELRDYLLPRLLSGAVRVSGVAEAEAAAEGMT